MRIEGLSQKREKSSLSFRTFLKFKYILSNGFNKCFSCGSGSGSGGSCFSCGSGGSCFSCGSGGSCFSCSRLNGSSCISFSRRNGSS